MATVLGLNAVFHDPAAVLVVDGHVVAAAEEERFSRRKHGKSPVPFSTWELPERAIRWCLTEAGLDAADVAAVGYSYDPSLAMVPADGDARRLIDDGWEGMRTLYVERAPRFLASLDPGFGGAEFVYVRHHVAHAASAYLAAPHPAASVMVLDGRGERSSYLAGRADRGPLEILASQDLPHSLGLLYEEVTAHLGFRRSSDEYKVMALASYGEADFQDVFRAAVQTDGNGGFRTDPIDLAKLAEPVSEGDELRDEHVALAASVQARLEEVILELARWVHRQSGDHTVTLAGGVALNCVANARLAADGPFDEVWVQPAAGDAGTALGAALALATRLGDEVQPMSTAALGPSWDDAALAGWLERAAITYDRPRDVAADVAEGLARDEIVAWFQGRSEFGPRALGHRSLLADPRQASNLERLNDVKGREQFRPVAPMVLAERAGEIFEGVIPSPYMLFVHRVRPEWRDRIPAVVHVDGTARIQTVDRQVEPLMARVLEEFEARTGVPVLVNTSLNTAGRPMVDDPRDALECFGSAPVDRLVLGPYVVRRARQVATR